MSSSSSIVGESGFYDVIQFQIMQTKHRVWLLASAVLVIKQVQLTIIKWQTVVNL